eukprot:gene7721-60929_t
MPSVHTTSKKGGKDRLSGSVCTPPTRQGFSSFVGTAEYIAPEIIEGKA